MPNFTHGYAFVAGVANYPHVRPLPKTVLNDATAVAAMLRDPARAGYAADHVRLALDRQAAKADVLGGLRWLAESTGPDDTAVFYFSGHGARVGEGASAINYLITYDARISALQSTAISSAELTGALNAIRAGRLVVLMDACHAGGTGNPKGELDPDVPEIKGNLDDQFYERLASGAGRVILASSKSTELSYILQDARNSVFTECMLEALDGRARHRGDGMVRILDVVDYVWEQVPARIHDRQHPILKAHDMDENFPIALLMGGDKSLAPAPANAPLTTAVDLVKLRDLIVARKKLEDLELLCQDVEQEMRNDGIDLQFDMEMVGGQGKPVRVKRLIEYLDSRGKLAYLVRRIRKEYTGEI